MSAVFKFSLGEIKFSLGEKEEREFFNILREKYIFYIRQDDCEIIVQECDLPKIEEILSEL